MAITKKEEWVKIDKMLDESLKRITDYLNEGRGDDFKTAMDFREILETTSAKFKNNEPDNAASSYIIGTNNHRVWYDEWTKKLGVDFDVLRWRLLYYDGRNYNHYDDCHWEWGDNQFS